MEEQKKYNGVHESIEAIHKDKPTPDKEAMALSGDFDDSGPKAELLTTDGAIALINSLIYEIREAQLPNHVLAIGKLEGAIIRLLQS